MLGTFLLLCMCAGILFVVLGKCWDKISEWLTKPVSYILPGLMLGAALTGIMFLKQGLFGELTLWGFHPFWVGFVPMTLWEIFRSLRIYFLSR